ncbi:MAG: uroporphyrinogen decarboxylase family protein [Acidobacteriia bacterium]|nr:uroporphyrinogen decarboxylase family protein [Terriglobia bacterium]
MNSRERVARAMRHEAVDRVPVMCQLALGHYFLNCQSAPLDIWHSTESFGEALVALQRRYRFDGILINLPGRDPQWRSYIQHIETGADGQTIHWKNGWITECPRDDNPHVLRPDKSRFFVAFEEIDPDSLFYIEPHDLSGTSYPYCWGFSDDPAPGTSFFPPWQCDTIRYVLRATDHVVSVHSEIFSPFTQLLELLDYANGLMALLDDPLKFKACLKALTRGTIEWGRLQAACGVDAILISSAFAGGGFISPQQYSEFVLPFEKAVIDGIHEKSDVPIYTHTCGRIADRLELMGATGTQGIDTLDPPPLGNVDLADAKKRIGDCLFIKGNLDPVNIMLKGTPEGVICEAQRCLEIGAPGGGYILSTACSVPPHAPPENILKLAEAAAGFDVEKSNRSGVETGGMTLS